MKRTPVSNKVADKVRVARVTAGMRKADGTPAPTGWEKIEAGTDADDRAARLKAFQTDPLAQAMLAAGWEAVLDRFDVIFPDVDLRVTRVGTATPEAPEPKEDIFKQIQREVAGMSLQEAIAALRETDQSDDDD